MGGMVSPGVGGVPKFRSQNWRVGGAVLSKWECFRGPRPTSPPHAHSAHPILFHHEPLLQRVRLAQIHCPPPTYAATPQI